ncbi:hypothetical protein EDB19DRAFT_1930672 [Suillus lakei]|nr:hypothetical protein EDB19DRAFT_1930672 [Suillus lakei]
MSLPSANNFTPSAISRSPTTSYIRLYASRSKAKSTADLVPGSKQALTSEAARLEYGKSEAKMGAAVEWYRKEVAALETRASGRVTPALLSPVRIELPGKGKDLNLKVVEQALYAAKLPNIVPQRQIPGQSRFLYLGHSLRLPVTWTFTVSLLGQQSKPQCTYCNCSTNGRGKSGATSKDTTASVKKDRNTAEVDKILHT